MKIRSLGKIDEIERGGKCTHIANTEKLMTYQKKVHFKQQEPTGLKRSLDVKIL